MSHGLDAAIPGAREIAQGLPLAPAVARATAALRTFDAHHGPLQPHVASGSLDKTAYARAHLMHVADHWRAFVVAWDPGAEATGSTQSTAACIGDSLRSTLRSHTSDPPRQGLQMRGPQRLCTAC